MSTPTADGSRVSRPLLIALAVVAAAAAAYLALTMLSSPDDGELTAAGPSDAPVPSADGTEVPDTDEETEDPDEIAAVEPTFEVFDARDPFEQLVSDDTGGAGDVGTTQPAADTTPTEGSDPADGSVPPDGTPPDSTGSPSQTTVGSTTILLDDVFTSAAGEKTALVVVDDEGFEATEGDTVAGKVTVLDIAGNCATMRYTDKRFILCEGEQITK